MDNFHMWIDLVDNQIIRILYSLIAVFVVVRMNTMMSKNSPPIEIAAWWFLGVGSFTVVVFDLSFLPNEWGHVMFGIGSGIVILLHTQPEWRQYIANRRRNPEPQLPPDCDQRCRTVLMLRGVAAKETNKRRDHVPS